MQQELNYFYRNLRLEWIFKHQQDKRSVLEKKFYERSDWNPPKACKEIEDCISRVQEKFDNWNPLKFIKDNLTSNERNLIKDIKNDENVVYMWEDKGPSFTKMTKDQYFEAGEG